MQNNLQSSPDIFSTLQHQRRLCRKSRKRRQPAQKTRNRKQPPLRTDAIVHAEKRHCQTDHVPTCQIGHQRPQRNMLMDMIHQHPQPPSEPCTDCRTDTDSEKPHCIPQFIKKRKLAPPRILMQDNHHTGSGKKRQIRRPLTEPVKNQASSAARTRGGWKRWNTITLQPKRIIVTSQKHKNSHDGTPISSYIPVTDKTVPASKCQTFMHWPAPLPDHSFATLQLL